MGNTTSCVFKPNTVTYYRHKYGDDKQVLFGAEYDTECDPVIEIDQNGWESTYQAPNTSKVTIKTHSSRKVVVRAVIDKFYADKRFKWKESLESDFCFPRLPWWTDVNIEKYDYKWDNETDPHAETIQGIFVQELRQNRLFIQLRSLEAEYEILIPDDSHLETNIYKNTKLTQECQFKCREHPVIVPYTVDQNSKYLRAYYQTKNNGKLRLYQSKQNSESKIRTRVVIRNNKSNNYVKVIRILYSDSIVNSTTNSSESNKDANEAESSLTRNDKIVLPFVERKFDENLDTDLSYPFHPSSRMLTDEKLISKDEFTKLCNDQFQDIFSKKMNMVAGNCLDLTLCEPAFYIIYIPADMALETYFENVNVHYNTLRRCQLHVECKNVTRPGQSGGMNSSGQSWSYFSYGGSKDPYTKIRTKNGNIMLDSGFYEASDNDIEYIDFQFEF
jgi:hypothetical protein